jgi:hypothetical protein
MCGYDDMSRHDHLREHTDMPDDDLSRFVHMRRHGDLPRYEYLRGHGNLLRRTDLLQSDDAELPDLPRIDNLQRGRIPDMRNAADLHTLPDMPWVGDLRAHGNMRSCRDLRWHTDL